jgi:hypothetical protein
LGAELVQRPKLTFAAVLSTVAIFSGLFAVPASAALPATFTTGIADSVYFSAHSRNAWLGRTVASGAQFVLLWVTWGGVAPQKPPPGTDASDPANPAYNWSTLDATVRAANARGLTVVLSIAGAPPWAEGTRRPRLAAPGTWRPNAAAYGAFARAVARRYSGRFNPGTGVLPRVRYFQAWVEPNLPLHLSPQWVRVRRHWVPESPIIYRGLLNAFYAAVKSVHSSDLVITAGTAPFGDPPGGLRVRPALFVRDLLCLRNQALAPAPCPKPAHFDILAHDPYSFAGPFRRAYYADDVSLTDMWKLTRAVAAANRTGRALPRGHHPVWVTEFGWNSRPPNPHGVPLIRQAQWIEEALYALWLQGIDTATSYRVVDQPPIPNYSTTWQTGLYFGNGRRKPAFEAFRFPFVVDRARSGRALVWGVSPASGSVLVQLRQSGQWTTILRLHALAHGVIARTLTVPAHALMRARVGNELSLGWTA